MRLGGGNTKKGQKKKTKQLFSFLYELIENILKLTFVTWGTQYSAIIEIAIDNRFFI